MPPTKIEVIFLDLARIYLTCKTVSSKNSGSKNVEVRCQFSELSVWGRWASYCHSGTHANAGFVILSSDFKHAVAAIIPSRRESGGVGRVVILMLLPCPRNGIYSTGDSLVMWPWSIAGDIGEWVHYYGKIENGL